LATRAGDDDDEDIFFFFGRVAQSREERDGMDAMESLSLFLSVFLNKNEGGRAKTFSREQKKKI
jgi:hypothetical protein